MNRDYFLKMGWKPATNAAYDGPFMDVYQKGEYTVIIEGPYPFDNDKTTHVSFMKAGKYVHQSLIATEVEFEQIERDLQV